MSGGFSSHGSAAFHSCTGQHCVLVLTKPERMCAKRYGASMIDYRIQGTYRWLFYDE